MIKTILKVIWNFFFFGGGGEGWGRPTWKAYTYQMFIWVFGLFEWLIILILDKLEKGEL